MVINNFRRDTFTFLSPATYKYFLHWQPYFEESSYVKVTPTGRKNSYLGPGGAMEYYTLQNRWCPFASFNFIRGSDLPVGVVSCVQNVE